jgi:hypothetical protein
MRALNNSGVLALWESGRRLHSLDRGLFAIRALGIEEDGEDAADWPLGRRNQALAEVHLDCFGEQLQGWTECGHCGEKLEFQIDCRSLIELQTRAKASPVLVRGRAFRAPTSRDLARIANEPDSESAALELMRACCLLNERREDCAPAAWSSNDFEELGMKVAEADPLAEILLSLECPVCKAAREQALDIAEFIWSELESFAKRILYEIHILASAYGWSEEQILSLSESRRSLYLQMVQA